jgi:hypothetical protein
MSRHSLIAILLAATVVGCEKLPAAPSTPDQPPSAAFFFTPVAPIYAGQSRVSFSAIGSSDKDGQVVSYVWDFGRSRPSTTCFPTPAPTA